MKNEWYGIHRDIVLDSVSFDEIDFVYTTGAAHDHDDVYLFYFNKIKYSSSHYYFISKNKIENK